MGGYLIDSFRLGKEREKESRRREGGEGNRQSAPVHRGLGFFDRRGSLTQIIPNRDPFIIHQIKAYRSCGIT